MDPIAPWLDRDELRRLAEALIAQPPEGDDPRAPETYGDSFEGFAEADAKPSEPDETGPAPEQTTAASGGEAQAREALSAARAIAARGGLLADGDSTSGPAPAAAAPSSRPARVPFVERLQTFGSWLREGISTATWFLLDREGRVLADEVHSAKLHQVAGTLARASRTATRQAGGSAVTGLRVRIGPEQTMEVVPINTRFGPLVLGVIVPRPLPPESAETLAIAMQRVLDARQ